MKIFILGLVALVCSLNVAGKDNSYSGWINIDGKKINFSLNFRIADNNLISGTSLTAKGTSDETRCKIKGRYTPSSGAIFFYETVVLSSKAKYENLNFCLLTANIRKTETEKTIVYKGKVTGYIRGTKKKCALGNIYLKTIKPKKLITPKVESLVSKPIVKADTLFSNRKSKKSITYTFNSDEIQLSIWDDIQADGDRVTVYLDGAAILTNYELTKDLKTVIIPLTSNKKSHYIKIVALNEGTATPNTSRIRLRAKSDVRELKTHITQGNEVYIQILK